MNPSYVIIIVILIILLALILIAIMSTKTITGSSPGSRARDVIEEALRREYMRWARSRAQVALVTENMSPKDAYEARAILERWHLSSNNFIADMGSQRAHPITLKMREEFLDKKLFTADNVDAVIDRMFAIKDDQRDETSRDGFGVRIIGGIIKVGKFTKMLPRERVETLLRMASPEQVAIAALRYATLVPGGQQWSVPSAVYRVLVEDYGVTLEGFASPFNSQLLMIDPQRLHYCSLFPDTDTVFGSVGNFFEYDFAGKVAVINPPYVIDIMESVISKCIKTCEIAREPTRMFIVVPNWRDAAFFKALSETKFLEEKIEHNAFETYFEDVNQSAPGVSEGHNAPGGVSEGHHASGMPILATFWSTVFILSAGGIAKGDYAKLREAFKPPPELSKRAPDMKKRWAQVRANPRTRPQDKPWAR